MLFEKHEDKRGYFRELFRYSEDKMHISQVSICHANPGEERGGHFHTIFEEIFIVIQGSMNLELENVKTKVRSVVHLDPDVCYYRVRPYEKHTVKSGAKGCTFVILSDREFNPDDTDTFVK